MSTFNHWNGRESSAKHLRRRHDMQRIRENVRLHVEREFAEDYHEWLMGKRVHEPTFEHYYAMRMLGEGKWLLGGCPVTHCFMCRNHDPKYADLVNNERMDAELDYLYRTDQEVDEGDCNTEDTLRASF